MAPINLGLIGYGFSARTFHLPFIAPVKDLNVYAVLQRTAPSSDGGKPVPHCTTDLPQSHWYRHESDFFADPAIGIVIVTSPADCHARYARLALQSGKHVVVEKPFTCTSAEADELITLAKGTGLILTCFQNRRLDGDFQTVQKLVGAGVFGEVIEFESHYDMDVPFAIPKLEADEGTPGTGMLYGLGSHTIDQALVLFGRPTTVTAFKRSLRPWVKGKLDDMHTILLQYGGEKGNLLVTIKSTCVTVMDKQLRFWVRGRKGSYIKHCMDIQETQIMGPSHLRLPVDDAGFGVEQSSAYGTLITTGSVDNSISSDQTQDPRTGHTIGKVPTVNGRWMGYYENLARTFRGEQEILVKPEEARDSIRLIELANESVRTGLAVPWT